MNRNNLSWVDNKVFSNQGAAQNTTRPYTNMAPAQSQGTQNGTTPTGVSPATYQDPAKAPAATGADPAATAPSAVSPATYQETPADNQTGLSPAQTMPAQTAPMQSAPMMPNTQNQTGLSPATYQKDPAIYPVQTGLSPASTRSTGNTVPGSGMGMPGVLTRDVTYGPDPFNVQGPPTVLDPGYIPAYLRTQIGKRVRAEFNIGTNMYMDRTGTLKEVGISYFVLEDNVTHVRVMCDLYSLKFLSTEA